jgi:two-component system OmpR family response regulator
MKILVVEDDARTAEFLLHGLKQSGYLCEHSPDGMDGLFKAEHAGCDLAVVDVMLPKLDGLTMISRMREQGINMPVIVLSARDAVDDRIRGLQAGGDDYMTKPFSFSELVARISALMRRSSGAPESSKLTVADLELDLRRRKARRGDVEIDLQPLEFSLLEYLVRHAGHVVSRTMIMEHVWEYNFDPRTNIVETRICHLREKIDKPFEIKLLHTVRGFGYVLEARSSRS